MIRTLLHKFAEGVAHFDNIEIDGRDHPTIKKMLESPLYIIDDDMVELLRKPSTSKVIEELVRSGVARLPYEVMVIEFAASPEYREFVLLRQKANSVSAQVAFFDHTKYVGTLLPEDLDIIMVEGGFAIAGAEYDDLGKLGVAAAMVAMNIAVLMLNTKGLAKTHVDCAVLNKHRDKKGKIRVPSHTVVHIGTVYNRSGQAVKYQKGTGRTMPVHLRAGHLRRQHYGPGNELIKYVQIPPCIVNFSEGDQVPVPRKVIKV